MLALPERLQTGREFAIQPTNGCVVVWQRILQLTLRQELPAVLQMFGDLRLRDTSDH